jgi:Mrp family chromosome partitioning ATPase
MASLGDAQQRRLADRMSKIAHVCLVLSGKGGVGKSSVAVQLALSLLHSQPGARIGLLDIDLTGPSLPRMLGLDGRDVHQSADGWVPVYLYGDGSAVTGGTGVLECMSIGFLLKSSSESVVWRGPKKTAMIRQFLGDVRWGDLDWLIIDTPPGACPSTRPAPSTCSHLAAGTSDEHISLLEQLQPLLQPDATSTLRKPTLSSVLVTTPQAVSLSDVAKEFSFTRRTALPVLGLVENLSGYACPHCGEVAAVFGQGGGEAFCDQENAKAAAGDGPGCRFLGRIPVDRAFLALMDSAATAPPPMGAHGVNGNHVAHASTLLERYAATPTFAIFKGICEQIVALTLAAPVP